MNMSLAAWLLSALSALLLLPAGLLLVQVLAALPPYRPRPMPPGRRPRVAVLVPAHDEARLIGRTLAAILPQLVEGDRLLVVADNCTDDTAAIAAAAGAEVIARRDAGNRGKAHALAFGIRHLDAAPPEVVVIVDGDCDIDGRAIERLAKTCLQGGRPVQALYLMRAPAGAALEARIAEFAWLVKNKVRPLGYGRLGLACQMTGSGMALAWPDARRALQASGHIVEDMQLGIDLARAGRPPLFCPDARAGSRFPETRDGIAQQRRRWEHGHLGMIHAGAPRLLAYALRRADVQAFALALDLCVPPLALLMLLVSAALAAGAALAALGGGTLPLALAAAALGLSGSAVLLAWLRHGRDVVPLAALARVPLYVLRKVPLYLRFVRKRQSAWVRTDRNAK